MKPVYYTIATQSTYTQFSFLHFKRQVLYIFIPKLDVQQRLNFLRVGVEHGSFVSTTDECSVTYRLDDILCLD